MATVDIDLFNTIQKALVDDIDSDLIALKWYVARQRTGKSKIATAKFSKIIYLGRIVLSRIIERPLAPFEYVGYWNGNSFDNRRKNLFVADIHQVNHRRRLFANNEARCKGVTFMKRNGKYRARLYVNGKAIHLGEFDHIERAAEAYRKAAENYYAQYAYPE